MVLTTDFCNFLFVCFGFSPVVFFFFFRCFSLWFLNVFDGIFGHVFFGWCRVIQRNNFKLTNNDKYVFCFEVWVWFCWFFGVMFVCVSDFWLVERI